MNMSGAMIYNKFGPSPAHKVTLEEFAVATEFLKSANVPMWADPLQALNYRLGHIAVELPSVEHSQENIATLLCNSLKEIGDVGAQVNKMLADGKVTGPELDKLKCEVRQALAAIIAIEARVGEYR